jgi:Transposase DDE domain
MQQRPGSRSCAKSTVAPEGTSETGRRDVGMFQHLIGLQPGAKLPTRNRPWLLEPLIERSFADASNLHGFKRARWRGLIKQSIQDLLIATVQNLRKLIAAIQNAPESVWKTLIRTLWPLYARLSALLTPRPRRQRTLASAEPASSVRLLPRRTQLFGQQTDLTRPRWHLLHPTALSEGGRLPHPR